MKGEVNENYLNSLLRLEIKNDFSIEQISGQFYKEARNYLDELKARIETENVKKNVRQVGRLTNELESSEKYLRKIIELRVSKILKARANNEKEYIEGKLTPEEQIFYENISKLVKEFMDKLEHGEIIVPVKEQEEVKEEEGKKGVNVPVYIMQDVKGISLMGKAVNLRKEDIITLPLQYAEVIEKQGIGKILRNEEQ
jgi:DNA replication initiation complex subunit (GINS family)